MKATRRRPVSRRSSRACVDVICFETAGIPRRDIPTYFVVGITGKLYEVDTDGRCVLAPDLSDPQYTVPTDDMLNDACALACGWERLEEFFVKGQEIRRRPYSYCSNLELAQELLKIIEARKLLPAFVQAIARETAVYPAQCLQMLQHPRWTVIAGLKTLDQWPAEWTV